MSGYTNDECEIPKIKSYPGADKEIASEIDYSIVKGTVFIRLVPKNYGFSFIYNRTCDRFTFNSNIWNSY